MVSAVGMGNNSWSPGTWRWGVHSTQGLAVGKGVREGEEFLAWEIGSPVDTDGRVDLGSKQTCSSYVKFEASPGPSGLRSRCQLTFEVWRSRQKPRLKSGPWEGAGNMLGKGKGQSPQMGGERAHAGE